LGRGPNRYKKVRDAEEAAPEWGGGQQSKATGQPVPPAENGALPHRAIPPVDEEPVHRKVQVCSYNVQAREHLFKNCPRWGLQDLVSGSSERD